MAKISYQNFSFGLCCNKRGPIVHCGNVVIWSFLKILFCIFLQFPKMKSQETQWKENQVRFTFLFFHFFFFLKKKKKCWNTFRNFQKNLFYREYLSKPLLLAKLWCYVFLTLSMSETRYTIYPKNRKVNLELQNFRGKSLLFVASTTSEFFNKVFSKQKSSFSTFFQKWQSVWKSQSL